MFLVIIKKWLIIKKMYIQSLFYGYGYGYGYGVFIKRNFSNDSKALLSNHSDF